MRRFAMNRWWAFMLAVGLLLTSSAALSESHAAGVQRLGWRSGLGVSSQMGDPDDPFGGGVTPSSKKGPAWSATPADSWTEGDGTTRIELQGWWYHVVVYGLRGMLYRF